jgi:hypothetical protein
MRYHKGEESYRMAKPTNPATQTLETLLRDGVSVERVLIGDHYTQRVPSDQGLGYQTKVAEENGYVVCVRSGDYVFITDKVLKVTQGIRLAKDALDTQAVTVSS